MQYQPRIVGAPNSLEYRVYIEDAVAKKVVSPFHDIPLVSAQHSGGANGTVYNMVVEIPRWSNAKLEICKEELFNPIKQDTKKGKLRFVRNVFPHHGYIWNYGALPQTWEDPNYSHPETKCAGDNDPIDAVEIGEAISYPGQVKQVKVLGIMAMVDEGETDWKLIVVDINDPLAPKLNDIEDVEKHLPGLLRATNEWFRIYKIPDGKPENTFAFAGEAKNRTYAEAIIQETHEAWTKLASGEIPSKGEDQNISVVRSIFEGEGAGAGFKVSTDSEEYKSLPKHDPKPANVIDPTIDKWFFLSGQANL